MMVKRLLSILLCTVLLCGLLPLVVFATDQTSTTTLGLRSSNSYDLIIAGIPVTSENADDILGNGKVSYDENENVLTLSDAVITAENNAYGIYSKDSLNILLVGENTVEIAGVVPSGNTTFAAIYIENGTLTFQSSEGSLTATTEAALPEKDEDVYSSCGIRANEIYVEPGVTVSSIGGEASFMDGFGSYGMLGEYIRIIGAKVEAAASNGYYSAAIRGERGINIEDSTINAVCNSYIHYSTDYNTKDSSSLYAGSEDVLGDILISGGSITASGGAATDRSAGIVTDQGNIVIENQAEVYANTEQCEYVTSEKGIGMGICAEGDLTVQDSKVFSYGAEGYLSAGLYAVKGNITLDGEVMAQGGRSNYTGMTCGTGAQKGIVTINGGKIISFAANLSEGDYGYGIFADSDIMINGGEVTASGCLGDMDGVVSSICGGIYSENGDITVSGEQTKVFGDGGLAGVAVYGIHSLNGNVVIEDGSTYAKSQPYDSYYETQSYGIVAGKTINTDNIEENVSNISICGGFVAAIGRTNSLFYNGSLIVNPKQSVKLIVKSGQELVPADYGIPEDEYWALQEENAAEIEASPFLKETIIDRDVIVNNQYFSSTAQEVDTYTVVFDTNGHGIAPASLTGILPNDIIEEPEAPVEEGWQFEGWYKESECENKWDFSSDKVTQNTILYAKWTEVTVSPHPIYTLTFDTNDGDKIDSVRFEAGTMVSLSEYTPTRTGYIFAGWYADEALTESVSSVIMNSDKIVYAKWMPVDSTTPQTSDHGGVLLWVALLCMSGCVLMTLSIRNIQKKDD